MHVREPAVAGAFYPASPQTLTKQVQGFLDAVVAPQSDTALPTPRALIVPHAGYVYSGSTAAVGYATLRTSAAEVAHVVILGPAHRYPVRGVALPGDDAFALAGYDIALPDLFFMVVPDIFRGFDKSLV